MRATAWGVVAAGIAAPLLRKRVQAPPLAMQTLAFAAPVGLCVAVRRSRRRDVAVCALQMWAYLAAYKTPHDDAAGQERRVRIDYPIAIDRALGLGELPTVRLQRVLARSGPDGPRWRTLDRVLVWSHWSWFFVPHGALFYILMCHRGRFDRAAVLTYAVFDVGAMIYWVLPTAPPWYAAAAPERGALAGGSRRRARAAPDARRAAHDGRVRGGLLGRQLGAPLQCSWRQSLGCDAVAALRYIRDGRPAARRDRTGRGRAGVGVRVDARAARWCTWASTTRSICSRALALTAAVRRAGPRATPALARWGRAVAALEAKAHETG